MAKAVRQADVGQYRHFIVEAHGQKGEVFALPEYAENALSNMLDELAVFSSKPN